jgi:type I restriction enzyme, R subunit
MSESNFIHISTENPQLASIGKLAERNVYLVPSTSLSKLRLLLENLTVFFIDFEQVNELHGLTQNERLRLTMAYSHKLQALVLKFQHKK